MTPCNILEPATSLAVASVRQVPVLPLLLAAPMSSVRSAAKQRYRQFQRPEGDDRRAAIYDVIFESDTKPGKWFDIGLLIAILASTVVVSLETVPEMRSSPDRLRQLEIAEWFLTVLFTLEYGMRLYCVRHPLRYAFSFWGVVDLLSFLPNYVMLLAGSSSHAFSILRSVRLLRVFRVLKLWRMMNEAEELSDAVWAARNKIIVFLAVVLVAVTISGTLMYQIENFGAQGSNEASDFTSIPQAMYWAIVTMATVGYGDVVPHTWAGKAVSSLLILLGYSLIIVPSTFVGTEIMSKRQTAEDHHCPSCDAPMQRADATYCYRCGQRLDGGPSDSDVVS